MTCPPKVKHRGSNDSCDSGLSLPTCLPLESGMGVSDEVIHEEAQGGANLSEYVAQRELSGQQCDGELLWTLKARDLLWARLP